MKSYEIDGIVIYKENSTNEESMSELLYDYNTQRGIDFDLLMGSFRIKIFDEKNNETFFFGDNSGNMCFYYNNDHACKFFLDLSSAGTPDLDRIAQFLMFGCIYDHGTIAKDVYRTNPDMYYTLKDGSITENPKGLSGFEELKPHTLEEITERYIKATIDKKKISVITGGYDSRTVLAHLLNKNTELELCITGEPDHIDVKIAKQISETTRIPLYSFGEPADTKDTNFIHNAFLASDGMYGVFSRYRLYNKSYNLKSMGYEAEFGGAAGELYKNSFINQDFPFYRGKPDLNKFRKLKIPSGLYKTDIFTKSMQKKILDVENSIFENLLFPEQNGKKSKFKTYTDIGYKIMQHRIITLTNSSSRYLIPLIPLMERSLVASIYSNNPYSMECAYFQRKQISAFYPALKNIKTDRGLNCSDRVLSIVMDIVKYYKYLLCVYLKRRFAFFRSKQAEERIDMVFSVGMASEEYIGAINVCKQIGILDEKVDGSSLPPVIADRLMTVGMVFDIRQVSDPI